MAVGPFFTLTLLDQSLGISARDFVSNLNENLRFSFSSPKVIKKKLNKKESSFHSQGLQTSCRPYKISKLCSGM